MAESEKILVTGNTYDCKDELKDRFGATFDKSKKGWWIDNKWYDGVVDVAKQYDLLIDGVPAINITGGDPTMQSPKPQPQTAAPPAKTGTSLPATTKAVTVDYLDAYPDGSKAEIIHTHRGDMRVFKKGVRLDESNTHSIEGKRSPSAIAYAMMADAAGIQVVKPDFIDDFDEATGTIVKKPNPYFDRDSQGRIVRVLARYVAIGFTPNGNLFMSDRIIDLNLITQLLHSLLKKIKGKPSVGQTMTLAAFKERPESMKNWGWYIQVAGADDESTFVVAINPEHEEIQDAFRGYGQLQKFAERHAQTKGITMALRNFPTIATPDLSAQFAESGNAGVWRVIRCVAHGTDALEKLAMKIKLGKTLEEEDLIIDADVIDVSQDGDLEEEGIPEDASVEEEATA